MPDLRSTNMLESIDFRSFLDIQNIFQKIPTPFCWLRHPPQNETNLIFPGRFSRCAKKHNINLEAVKQIQRNRGYNKKSVAHNAFIGFYNGGNRTFWPQSLQNYHLDSNWRSCKSLISTNIENYNCSFCNFMTYASRRNSNVRVVTQFRIDFHPIRFVKKNITVVAVIHWWFNNQFHEHHE